MNDDFVHPGGQWGLLANGSSGRWDIAVDEAWDREEWSLTIEGPRTHLAFQLQDLSVIPTALRFLQEGLHAWQGLDRTGSKAGEDALTLGRFGSASVSLRWDNEDFPRCFIVIEAQAGSTMFISLDATDVQMLIEALQQVVQDLPPAAGE
jgi:hypothetical protein